jgi:dihydropteroate synthase
MADRFNIRVLGLPTIDDLARAVSRIEPYPERVAAAALKGQFLVIHAADVGAVAAMILKQELLALDGDCVVSPAVYLGDRDAVTDTLIMATTRQLRALVPRLRVFPLGDLPRLADELEQVLNGYGGERPTTMLKETTWRWGERTYVMGIVNATPDSFSGDGLIASDGTFDEPELVRAAVAQAQIFADAGADILDIGGESTRPGAGTVTVAEELARVIPVVGAIGAVLNLPLSIDTSRTEVAAAALDAGASMINDVWGLRKAEGGWNEPLAHLAAVRGVPIVLMHNRRAHATSGQIGGYYRTVAYENLMGEIIKELREQIAYATARGIRPEQIIIDPGIGFGKTPDQNIEVLRQLSQLRSLGQPILLGTSRKSFIGRATGTGPSARMEGTAATVALGIQAGADIVRVHDVASIVKVARMTDAIVRPGAWERMMDESP